MSGRLPTWAEQMGDGRSEPQPPHERFVCTAWRLIGPNQEKARCEVWELSHGFELRELHGDEVVRTLLCRETEIEAAHIADESARELEAQGFTEIPDGPPR